MPKRLFREVGTVGVIAGIVGLIMFLAILSIDARVNKIKKTGDQIAEDLRALRRLAEKAA